MINSFTSLLVILPLVALAGEKNCADAPAQRDGHSSISRPESASHVVSVTASLRDSSRIKGILLTRHLRGSTLFHNDLTLSPKCVSEITFADANGPATVRLSNGDILTVTLATTNLTVKSSILGELEIPTSKMKKLIFQAKRDSSDGLIFHCTFDSLESVQKPAIGPAACYNKATLAPGNEGNALRAQTYTPQAAYDLPPNFLGKAGCIEFWAKILKPNPSVGWGGDPRFFTLSSKTTGDTFSVVDIVSNNGGGNSGFATWTLTGNIASIGGMRSLTYQELFDKGSWRDWHHYAIVWDDSGIKGISEEGRRAALFVDGKLTPCAKFDNRNTAELERLIASSSRLSFTYDPDQDHERQTKSPFLIDEFKIWNYAKTDFQLGD